MSLCAFWGCVVLVALFVDSWWASGGQSKFHGEWVSFRNRVVLLWVCPGSSLPSVYSMHTSCNTPAADMIKREILYLMDVFHVVYVDICAPQPISLR